MLIVRVELHSAITGVVTEIARMRIFNAASGTKTQGNYMCQTFRGRTAEDLDRKTQQRSGTVIGYPRLSLHVWHLVARSLIAMGYAGKNEQLQGSDMEEAQ